MPELSIVIPTFNTAAMTLQTCRDVLAAAPSAEIIVVDDASTDDTAELLHRELPNITVLRMETNRRFAGAANAGVAASRANVILLLNSDARVDPEAPSALLAALEADPHLGIAGARLLNCDGSPQWSGGPLPTLLWLFVMVSGCARFLPRRRRASTGDAGWVSGAAMAFRREVWNAAGPLRESYRFYAQDLDFCGRAGALGWHVRVVESARVIHDGGATVRRWRDVAELPHDPALLWPDVLDWARTHLGIFRGRAAKPVMCAAAMLRLTARRLRELFMRAEARRRSQSTTRIYTRALRQLLVEREQPAGEGVAGVTRLDEPPAGLSDRARP
jgi:hypothetical protein